jgi:uncharacterized membrane protein (DUF2068 family)
MAAPKDPALGIRLIVIYKLVRGSIALAASIVLAVAAIRGGGKALHELADRLRDHIMGAWSMRLADLVDRASSPRSLKIGALALGCDGLLTIFEGWALQRQFRFAPWLVVIATGSFVPLEFYELSRKFNLLRLTILALNIAVVLYLVRRKLSSTSAGQRPSPQ